MNEAASLPFSKEEDQRKSKAGSRTYKIFKLIINVFEFE
jgi:hypothetical protein